MLGPTILVGPQMPAIASGVALGAALLSTSVWMTEPEGSDRSSRVWARIEGTLAVLAATIVFAAPGSGGGIGELFGDLPEVTATAGALVVGIVVVLMGPRLLRSKRVRWVVLAGSGVAVIAAAGIVAGSL